MPPQLLPNLLDALLQVTLTLTLTPNPNPNPEPEPEPEPEPDLLLQDIAWAVQHADDKADRVAFRFERLLLLAPIRMTPGGGKAKADKAEPPSKQPKQPKQPKQAAKRGPAAAALPEGAEFDRVEEEYVAQAADAAYLLNGTYVRSRSSCSSRSGSSGSSSSSMVVVVVVAVAVVVVVVCSAWPAAPALFRLFRTGTGRVRQMLRTLTLPLDP